MLISLRSSSKAIAEKAIGSHDGLAAKFATILLSATESSTIDEVGKKTGWPAETIRRVLEKYKQKGDSFLYPRPSVRKPLFKNWLFTTYEGAEWEYYKGALLISSLANSQVVMDKIKAMFPEPKGKCVLDVGAGEGAQAMMLRDAGFSVECIDVESLRYIPLDIPFRHLDADEGLARSLPEEKYDLVIAIEVLGYLREPFKFFEEAFALLRPGGCLLITMNNITSFVSRATFATEGTFLNCPKGQTNFEHHPSITTLPWFAYERMFRAVGFEDVETEETDSLSIVCLQSWKHILHSVVRLIMYVLSLKSPSDPRVGKQVLVCGRKPITE